MKFENFPKNYKWLQKIFEGFVQKQSRDKKAQDKAVRDMSEELSTKITDEGKRLEKKIGGDEKPGVPTHLPKPKDFKAYEFAVFGWAFVDPYLKWKYFGKIEGYEFYGSPNSGFSPKDNTYSQSGIHRGGNASDFLYTKDIVTPANTFYLDNRIIGLVIKNVTTGEEGTIYSFDLWEPLVKIYAKKADTSWLQWNTDDAFIIKEYPANRLFSIDAFCLFLKPPIIPFYVLARTTGKGHSFSDFTAQVSTQDPEITLAKPVILAPRCKIHMASPSEERCTMTDEGKPYCSYCARALEWDEVFDGSMETAHFGWFGTEWCEVELWIEVEDVSGVWLDFAQGSSPEE